MKKFKLISILFSFSCIFLNAQSGCFEIESILVNSCSFGNEEGRNEMLRFRVGNTPLSTNDMTVAWANTNLPWNGLIQDGSTAQATAAFILWIIERTYKWNSSCKFKGSINYK